MVLVKASYVYVPLLTSALAAVAAQAALNFATKAFGSLSVSV
jgi:hypothetical protein